VVVRLLLGSGLLGVLLGGLFLAAVLRGLFLAAVLGRLLLGDGLQALGLGDAEHGDGVATDVDCGVHGDVYLVPTGHTARTVGGGAVGARVLALVVVGGLDDVDDGVALGFG